MILMIVATMRTTQIMIVITRMTKIMIVMFVAIMRTRTTKKDNDCDMRMTKEILHWLQMITIEMYMIENR